MSIATTPLLLGLLAGAAAAGPAQEGLGARYRAVRAEADAAVAAATAAVEGHLARVEPLEASETSRAYRAQVDPLVELGPAAVPALLTAMAAPLPGPGGPAPSHLELGTDMCVCARTTPCISLCG